MTRRGWRVAVGVSLLFVAAADLRAGVSLDGYGLGGPGGYRERSLAATLSVKPPIEWDDPDVSWPFTLVSLHARRTGYQRDGVSGPTYTTEFGAGVTIFQRSYAGVSYQYTPALSEDIGAYRMRGWSATVSAGWEGWLPQFDVDDRKGTSPIETLVTLTLGRTRHEERVAVSTSSVQWNALRENVVGAVLEETLWGVTTLRAAGEDHGYDLEVQGLARRLEFFSLGKTRASASPELLRGFLRRSWGAGLDQRIGKRFELSGDWRRSSYEDGPPLRSDTYSGRGTVFWGLHLSTYVRYEVFAPLELPRSEYRGAGVEFHF
jgi:hypothetical protein